MGVAGGPAHEVVADGEQGRADQREHGTEHAPVLGPRPLPGQQRRRRRRRAPCPTNVTHFAGSFSSVSAISDRDQRRHADQDRRARRAGVTHGDDEEDLRHARDERSRERKRPQIAGVDGPPSIAAPIPTTTTAVHIRAKRTGLRVDPGSSEAPADGERQDPEQRAGQRGEQDGGHALRSAHGADAHGEDHRRPPGRRGRRGDRARRRRDPARGRDGDDGVPPVRAARPRPRPRADGLVRRPQRDPVRQPQPGGPRVPPQLGDAVRRALLAAGERDRPLPAPRAVRAAGPRPASAPTRTRRWRARSGCSRSEQGRPRWRSRWRAGPTSSSGRVVVGVELRGRLEPWVQSKDVVLELLRRRGVRGGRGCIFEFHGDGVETLSATDRGTICNMVDGDRRDDRDLPLGRADAHVARRPGPRGALARAGRRPGRAVRRDGDDRPRRPRAADRAPLVAGERRARARGGRRADEAGVRRLLRELVVRGSRDRRGRAARAGRSRPSST